MMQLAVTSVPPGAEIFVDGKDLGKTTNTVLSLRRSATTTTIRLQLKGYDDYVFPQASLDTDNLTEAATLKKAPSVVRPNPPAGHGSGSSTGSNKGSGTKGSGSGHGGDDTGLMVPD
jgi:hypothetical protein